MENWYVHPACNQTTANWLMKMFYLIKTLHEKFKETIFIDLTRVHMLFNEKGDPIKERWDEGSTFWTKENPLPINVIQDDKELLALWDSATNLQTVFQQTKSDVQWLFQIRTLHDTCNMAIVCQDVMEIETDEPVGSEEEPENGEMKKVKVATLNAYLIQRFQNDNGETDYILTMDPNSKLQWYCRYCCRAKVSSMICAKCKPPAETNPDLENYSKPGVFYCDKKCQTADWPRHKLECQSHASEK